jgi:hypothetical protein
MSPTWIAEEHVVFVHPNGDRRRGRIAVGLPARGPEHASCPIELEGLEPCKTIHGDTTLQALLLAMRFLGMRLHDLLSRGGRVIFYPGDRPEDDVDGVLEALFGPLLRDPEPRPTAE